MSTIQLEGLWAYIQTLSLNKQNKQWLAERLVMPDATEKQEQYVSETLTAALKETKTHLATGAKMPNAFDLLNELEIVNIW